MPQLHCLMQPDAVDAMEFFREKQGIGPCRTLCFKTTFIHAIVLASVINPVSMIHIFQRRNETETYTNIQKYKPVKDSLSMI